MGYTITLLVFAIISSVRGRRSFMSSVLTTNFLAPREGGVASEKQEYYANQGSMAPQFTGQTTNTQYTNQSSQPYPPSQGTGQPVYQNGPGGYPPMHGGGHPGVPQV